MNTRQLGGCVQLFFFFFTVWLEKRFHGVLFIRPAFAFPGKGYGNKYTRELRGGVGVGLGNSKKTNEK